MLFRSDMVGLILVGLMVFYLNAAYLNAKNFVLDDRFDRSAYVPFRFSLIKSTNFKINYKIKKGTSVKKSPLFKRSPAAFYSPTRSPLQYHRR